jgi:hypothetical protein
MLNWDESPNPLREQQFEDETSWLTKEQWVLGFTKFGTNRKLYLPGILQKVKSWDVYTLDNKRCIEFSFTNSFKRKVLKERKWQHYILIPGNVLHFPKTPTVTLTLLTLEPLVYKIT